MKRPLCGSNHSRPRPQVSPPANGIPRIGTSEGSRSTALPFPISRRGHSSLRSPFAATGRALDHRPRALTRAPTVGSLP